MTRVALVTSDENDDAGRSSHATHTRFCSHMSQAEVFRADDGLLLERKRPTIDRVRMRVGRGSPNTVNEHLDAWWLRLGARLKDIPEREFPQDTSLSSVVIDSQRSPTVSVDRLRRKLSHRRLIVLQCNAVPS